MAKPEEQGQFLPMVPGGGTMGLQMDFSSSPHPPSPSSHLQLGWKGNCNVDRGSCAVYALLFQLF